MPLEIMGLLGCEPVHYHSVVSIPRETVRALKAANGPPSGVVPRPPRCVPGKTVERQFKCSFQGRKVRVRAATQVALLDFRAVNVDLPPNL